MRPSSSGSVMVPPPSALESRKRRPGSNASSQHTRPEKKASLHPSRGANKENDGVKDEKAMMDDLMAGLDASMFDGLDSSPVRSQKWSQSKASQPRDPVASRKPTETQASSPGATLQHSRREALAERQLIANRSVETRQPPSHTRPVPAFKPIKLESLVVPLVSELRDTAEQSLKQIDAIKPALEDEDEFAFDFDLGDFAHLEDDVLLKPHVAAKPIYPIRNPEVPKPPDGYRSTPWARCKVDAVFDGLLFEDGEIPANLHDWSVGGPSRIVDKTLVVTSAESSRHVVHLKHRWADMPVKQGTVDIFQSTQKPSKPETDHSGDIINIISPTLADSPLSGVIEVSFKTPATFLIHHPDLMLTMTSIANAMPCPRKPVLQTLVKSSGPSTKPILYGNMGHTLLQTALVNRSFAAESTRQVLDQELNKDSIKLDIWGAGLGIEDVRAEVAAQAEVGFQAFGDKWVGAQPNVEGELHHTPGDHASQLAINGLHDIEEDIWSPKWGLKGKVDASVQASIRKDPSKPDCAVEEHVAPLEIKTGRAIGVMAHRAQTMLYTLLMEDRYGVPVPAGLLYYSKLDSILRVEARPNEIRALIMARNELAAWMSKRRTITRPDTPPQPEAIEDAGYLPPTINHARECKSCYAVDSCMLYRKTVDRAPVSEEDEIMELYLDKAGHITEAHAAFYRKWDDLLTVEEQDANRFRAQLWTMTAARREQSGRCFADLVISAYSDDSSSSLQKTHRHTYTFTRAAGHHATQRDSLLSGHIARGDPVSISIEPDLLCMQRGFVVELTPTTAVIGLTYNIDLDSLLSRTKHRRSVPVTESDVRFRIDKDEMSSGIMRMRNNLAQLFYKDGDEKRRRLVVDLEEPYFEPARAPRPEEIPSGLNVDQVQAMHRVLTARDYALVLGMPGTGKTTTIAEIIRALVKRGKSVLLTSYTHSAVDTILMKLLGTDFGILRLGNIDKVHPSVRTLTLDSLPPTTSMAQMDTRLMDPPVVAATCLAIDHPLFFRRKFDYCIVDEASQITLPTCLGPLRMADTFVLVGDHFQLPPIVKNAEARRGGLDVSLFKLLSEQHPRAVVDLSHQYRMNEDIMLLSNRLVYENRLKCGSEQVARQGLVIPRPHVGQEAQCGERDCWIERLMLERTKAVFVDTDRVPAFDSRIGDLVQNETEARLVHQLASALTTSGVEQEDVAIITPYRQQIKLLSSQLGASLPNIEILTADKSQGRDKDCIIISLVRSNETGYIGELLRDWRRINVSFTRAKKKLVIFGSARTLASDPLLKGFLDLMEENNWVMRLEPGADKIHHVIEAVVKTEEKEDGKTGKTVKREGKLGDRAVNGRPFLKEVLESE